MSDSVAKAACKDGEAVRKVSRVANPAARAIRKDGEAVRKLSRASVPPEAVA